MDIVTYALCKKFALSVSAGFSSVTVDEPTSTIVFTLNDGNKVSLKIPTPEDGISVTGIAINETNHLICTLSDGQKIDAGEIPEQIIKISSKDGNALQRLDDGYYVSLTGVTISSETENILEQQTDGLFVPSLKLQKESLTPLVEEIITDSMEQEDIDFSTFYA